MPIEPATSLENLKLERDAIVLYESLAAIEKDPRRSQAFRTIASNERRHADIWVTKLRELGVDVPAPDRPRLRIRFIVAVARVFGTHAVADLVQALEGDEEAVYEGQEVAGSPEIAAIAADEREHAEIWKRLGTGDGRNGVDRAAPTSAAVSARDGIAEAGQATRPSDIGKR